MPEPKTETQRTLEAANDLPKCRVCTSPGYPRAGASSDADPKKGAVECVTCGRSWQHSDEYKLAKKVAGRHQAALGDVRRNVADLVLSDRERARELFEAAGTPLPAWLIATRPKSGPARPEMPDA